MKQTILKSVIILLLSVSAVSNIAFAQFEQKLTLQASGGYVESVAPDWFYDYFPNGLSLDAGVQYNFNRSFSIVALVKLSTFFLNSAYVSDDFDFYFYHFGLSIGPKYRFFPRARLNPYVLAGISMNYMAYSMYYDGEEEFYEYPTSLGVTGGAGLDFRVTDNFALFLQGGAYSFLLKSPETEEWLNTFGLQVGFNLNLFKSKSL